MKTLYEQLGVTPQASHTAIQQSYQRLTRKLDPDNTLHLAGEHARAEYLAVQNAYRTLSDVQTRAEYDRDRLQSSHPMPRKNNPATLILAVAARQGEVA